MVPKPSLGTWADFLAFFDTRTLNPKPYTLPCRRTALQVFSKLKLRGTSQHKGVLEVFLEAIEDENESVNPKPYTLNKQSKTKTNR